MGMKNLLLPGLSALLLLHPYLEPANAAELFRAATHRTKREIKAMLAARYPQQTLSTIVMANSYRHPPLLAKMAATLQELSGGRFVLGYGAGWMDHEYRAYGYDFPSPKIRIEQMVEGIQIMKAMWTGEPATFEGKYYRIEDAICVPSPQPPPPILIGGSDSRVG